MVEDSFQGNAVDGRPEAVIQAIRGNFQGAYIANGNYGADEARQRIKAGKCDLVSFGRPFISNPDLPERFRKGTMLNDYDEATFYGGDERLSVSRLTRSSQNRPRVNLIAPQHAPVFARGLSRL